MARGKISTGFAEHTIFAIIVYGLFLVILNWFDVKLTDLQYVVTFGLMIIAALFPDTDTNSKGQDIFYTFFVLLDLYLIIAKRWQEAAILGFIAMWPVVSKHRGWTHSVLAAFILPLPLLFPEFMNVPTVLTGSIAYAATVSGYLSHIFLDRTQNGILRVIFFWK